MSSLVNRCERVSHEGFLKRKNICRQVENICKLFLDLLPKGLDIFCNLFITYVLIQERNDEHHNIFFNGSTTKV